MEDKTQVLHTAVTFSISNTLHGPHTLNSEPGETPEHSEVWLIKKKWLFDGGSII